MRSEHRLRRALLLLVLPLAFAASISGCATPGPVVRLVPRMPREGDISWVGGRAVVQHEKEGVRVAAAFDHQTSTTLGIRVEVENRSDETLDVTPSGVLYVTCQTPDTCSHRYKVIDPEEMLATLDANRAREQAAASNDAAIGGALLFLSLATDIASLSSRETRRSYHSNTGHLASSMEHDQARHDRAIVNIQNDRQAWSVDALRRTTLRPGQGIAGYVYVPINLDAQLVWLQVNVNGRKFPFWYDQKTTKVY